MRCHERMTGHHTSEKCSSKKTDSLMPICSGEALLTRHQPLIRQIATLAGVPDGHFEKLYLSALTAYAAFVQKLPIAQICRTANDETLLDRTLTRLFRALSQRQGYLLPTEAEPEVIAAKADLWTYTVFAASLLQDIDQTVSVLNVSLFDKDQNLLGPWNAYGGAMTEPAVWYRVDSLSSVSLYAKRQITPLLARFVVPPVGLDWLWSDDEALCCWLSTLNGDSRTAGVLDEMIGTTSMPSIQ